MNSDETRKHLQNEGSEQAAAAMYPYGVPSVMAQQFSVPSNPIGGAAQQNEQDHPAQNGGNSFQFAQQLAFQQQQQQQHLAFQQQQRQQQLLAQTQQQNQILAPHQPMVNQINMNPYLGVTHNLIPHHLQAASVAPSLNGTPGHPSALISPLTVQDRPLVPPVYNGVNPNYPGLRLVHVNPPIFAVDNFLTPMECLFLVNAAIDAFGPAPVVGKGAGEVSPSRTSSTCYLAREDLPDYMRKVSLLTGKPVEHCELPQVGRYFPTQQYLQHFDAFDLSNEDGRRFAANGGQRTVTVLVYLNDVAQGGSTAFPALGLQVQPRQGTALVFFPATVDGLLDKMALHAALPAIDTKFVSQVWIRQGEYKGVPSKRLPQTMGVPFGQEQPNTNLVPHLY